MSSTKAKAAPASTVAPPAANTSKRDYLIDLEHAAQKRWAEEKMFETDSPYSDGTLEIPEQDFAKAAAKAREERPKWMGTFPYPVSSLCFISGRAEEAAATLLLGLQGLMRARCDTLEDCTDSVNLSLLPHRLYCSALRPSLSLGALNFPST